MPIPMGRFNRGLFHKDKLVRRLPPHVVKELRFTELVVEVWVGPVKNKQGYRSAVVTENGLYILAPYKKLSVLLSFSDLAYPFRHKGKAYFIENKASKSQHIVILRRDAVNPKTEARHLYTFMEHSNLLHELQVAWINWHIRHFNGLPILTSVNKKSVVNETFRKVCNAMRSEKKEGRTKWLLQLADAGHLDRHLKKLFFKSWLCEFVIAELKRCSDPKRPHERLYSMVNLEYVVALTTALRSMLFNSEMVPEREELLHPRPYSLEAIIHIMIRMGNPNTVALQQRSWEPDADEYDFDDAAILPPAKTQDKIHFGQDQLDIMDELLLAQVDAMIEMHSLVETAYANGNMHASDEVMVLGCHDHEFVRGFLVRAMLALLQRVTTLKAYRQDWAQAENTLHERRRKRARQLALNRMRAVARLGGDTLKLGREKAEAKGEEGEEGAGEGEEGGSGEGEESKGDEGGRRRRGRGEEDARRTSSASDGSGGEATSIASEEERAAMRAARAAGKPVPVEGVQRRVRFTTADSGSDGADHASVDETPRDVDEGLSPEEAEAAKALRAERRIRRLSPYTPEEIAIFEGPMMATQVFQLSRLMYLAMRARGHTVVPIMRVYHETTLAMVLLECDIDDLLSWEFPLNVRTVSMLWYIVNEFERSWNAPVEA